jgi:hypothetical protein
LGENTRLLVHLTVDQFPLAAFRRPDSKSYRGYPSTLQTSCGYTQEKSGIMGKICGQPDYSTKKSNSSQLQIIAFFSISFRGAEKHNMQL